jgi:hypothetical protein
LKGGTFVTLAYQKKLSIHNVPIARKSANDSGMRMAEERRCTGEIVAARCGGVRSLQIQRPTSHRTAARSPRGW